MKKLIIISSIILFAFFTNKLQAQSEAGYEFVGDVLRFTSPQPNGSSRIQAMGGSQTALGGDISNASGNPAGLGFFNKSEFSISPAISVNSSRTSFLGTATSNGYGNLNINNLGFVFSKAKDAIVPGKWRGGSFAITFNTNINYNNRFRYTGLNDTTSFSDALVERANGVDYSILQNEVNDNGEFTTWEALAFSTALIDTIWEGPDDSYFGYNELETNRQTEVVTTKGSQSQWNFSYGGNYNDKLYFGASIGLASFRYEEEKVYKEVVTTDNDGFDDLTDFTVTEYLTTRGSGINGSIGIIYRAADFLRLGGSIQTPTYFYSVSSKYDANLVTNFNDNPYGFSRGDGELQTTENRYKFRTPWKFTGGLAFFFSKNGFLTADVDYLAYNKIKLIEGDNELVFNANNEDIKNNFKSAINFRIGGEYRLNIFRFRAGYALYGTALERNDGSGNNDKATQFVSAGAGIRLSKFYIDFALVNTFQRKFNYYPYQLEDFTEPEASVTTSRTKGMVTLGFHF